MDSVLFCHPGRSEGSHKLSCGDGSPHSVLLRMTYRLNVIHRDVFGGPLDSLLWHHRTGFPFRPCKTGNSNCRQAAILIVVNRGTFVRAGSVSARTRIPPGNGIHTRPALPDCDSNLLSSA